jgi:hypothetical protein
MKTHFDSKSKTAPKKTLCIFQHGSNRKYYIHLEEARMRFFALGYVCDLCRQAGSPSGGEFLESVFKDLSIQTFSQLLQDTQERGFISSPIITVSDKLVNQKVNSGVLMAKGKTLFGSANFSHKKAGRQVKASCPAGSVPVGLSLQRCDAASQPLTYCYAQSLAQ